MYTMIYSSCQGNGYCGSENRDVNSNYQIVADAYANGSKSHSSPGYINTNHPDAAKYRITSI